MKLLVPIIGVVFVAFWTATTPTLALVGRGAGRDASRRSHAETRSSECLTSS